jgi:hypothetical protein
MVKILCTSIYNNFIQQTQLMILLFLKGNIILLKANRLFEF